MKTRTAVVVAELLAIGGVEAACGGGRQSTSSGPLTRIVDGQNHQRATMASTDRVLPEPLQAVPRSALGDPPTHDGARGPRPPSRIGHELGALRVGRLQLLRGRVEVAETVSEVTGHGLVYGPTKTYERRAVPIPRSMCEELGAYLAERPAHPEAFVFTAPDGGPLRHHNFMARHFRPAVSRAKLPERLRFDDLRHTCAALLINTDPPAHPLAVMKRLGHSAISVTYDTYGAPLPLAGGSPDRFARPRLLGKHRRQTAGCSRDGHADTGPTIDADQQLCRTNRLPSKQRVAGSSPAGSAWKALVRSNFEPLAN